ncbi:hypothetical protein F4818DRAFT_417571 [Hypoxylon cercidicola]|nr:hypothetical protein F4818DRAFT_417571 [Hypoxylon cercidicola]
MVYHDIDIPLPAFIVIDWVGMTIALIPIVLRFWVRSRESQQRLLTLDLSDSLVLLSWLSGMVLISINTWKNSLRQRYVHLPPDELYYSVPRPLSSHLLYVSWVSLFFIYISLWAAKFALLAFFASFLRRMEKKSTRVVLVCACVFTGATFLLHMVLLTAWCSPVSSNWDIEGRLCSAVHDIKSVSISTAANIATDLVILAVPIFAFFTLSRERRGLTMRTGMGKAEISGIVFVLCMAALSIVAALARWITLLLVQNVPKANITHTIDVWALVEIVAGLVAVCLPSLRSFVRKQREGGTRKKLAKNHSERREYIILEEGDASWRANRQFRTSGAEHATRV